MLEKKDQKDIVGPYGLSDSISVGEIQHLDLEYMDNSIHHDSEDHEMKRIVDDEKYDYDDEYELVEVLSSPEEQKLFSQRSAGRGALTYTTVLLRDPREFVDKGYMLRAASTHTKVMVVITMYNEQPLELVRTLRGICENIRTMCHWIGDMNLWEQFAIVIVSDGRSKANTDTLNLLADLGLYSERVVENALRDKAK